jgi:hypothetical protein
MVGVPPGLIYTTRESSPHTSVDYNLLAYPLISSEQSSFILGKLVLPHPGYRWWFGMSGELNNLARHIRAYAAANSDVGLFCIWTGSLLLIPFIRPTAGCLRRAPVVWPRTYFCTRVDLGDIHAP